MKKQLFFALFLTIISFVGFSQELKIQLTKLDVKKGFIYIAVYDSEAHFNAKQMQAKKRIEAVNSNQIITFSNLPKGKLSVAVFYDENDNKQIDLQKNGIPAEPFGFSNNPSVGIPTYQKTAFSFDKDTNITIEMKNAD